MEEIAEVCEGNKPGQQAKCHLSLKCREKKSPVRSMEEVTIMCLNSLVDFYRELYSSAKGTGSLRIWHLVSPVLKLILAAVTCHPNLRVSKYVLNGRGSASITALCCTLIHCFLRRHRRVPVASS